MELDIGYMRKFGRGKMRMKRYTYYKRYINDEGREKITRSKLLKLLKKFCLNPFGALNKIENGEEVKVGIYKIDAEGGKK